MVFHQKISRNRKSATNERFEMFLLFPFFRGDFYSFRNSCPWTFLSLFRLYKLTSTRITNYLLFRHENTSS